MVHKRSISLILYMCVTIGLCGTMAYAMTFYVSTYNEIYYPESNDANDLPFTLAIVECSICAATLLLGVLAYSGPASKQVLFVGFLFFVFSTLASGSISAIRGWNLGLVGDDLERTCSDTTKSGCPTSRFEAVAHNPTIEYTSPKGGDCQFWFWGPNMRARYTGETACNGYGQSDGVCGDIIETYMDWTQSYSYGLRDDPDDIVAASSGQLVTVDQIHNMKYLFGLQSSAGNVSIPMSEQFTEQPSIAYCWYWGCSSVCQPMRYMVNRWWLGSSIVLFVTHLILPTFAALLWRRNPQSAKPALPVTTLSVPEMSVPEFGRRKRRLVQNPSGLQF